MANQIKKSLASIRFASNFWNAHPIDSITCCYWAGTITPSRTTLFNANASNFISREFSSTGTNGNAQLNLPKTPFNHTNHYQCSYLIAVTTRGEKWIWPTHLHIEIVWILMNFMHIIRIADSTHKLSKLNGWIHMSSVKFTQCSFALISSLRYLV